MKRIFSFLVMTIALSTLLISCGGDGGGGTSGGTSGGEGGTPPTAFELVSPANGATGVSLTPTLQWTDSTGESSYILQGDKDSSFSNPGEFRYQQIRRASLSHRGHSLQEQHITGV